MNSKRASIPSPSTSSSLLSLKFDLISSEFRRMSLGNVSEINSVETPPPPQLKLNLDDVQSDQMNKTCSGIVAIPRPETTDSSTFPVQLMQQNPICASSPKQRQFIDDETSTTAPTGTNNTATASNEISILSISSSIFSNDLNDCDVVDEIVWTSSESLLPNSSVNSAASEAAIDTSADTIRSRRRPCPCPRRRCSQSLLYDDVDDEHHLAGYAEFDANRTLNDSCFILEFDDEPPEKDWSATDDFSKQSAEDDLNNEENIDHG